MRIITGSAKGRRLIAPEGTDVRPTTERVKEALFSIIQFEIEGRRVLDLFAGTGQLGLEALSRGAAFALFVDQDKRSVEIVKKNVALTGFSAVSEVVQREAVSYLRAAPDRFDLVFMDPPYGQGLCAAAAAELPRVLKPTSVVICETGADETLPDAIGALPLAKTYRYSTVRLTVYRS